MKTWCLLSSVPCRSQKNGTWSPTWVLGSSISVCLFLRWPFPPKCTHCPPSRIPRANRATENQIRTRQEKGLGIWLLLIVSIYRETALIAFCLLTHLILTIKLWDIYNNYLHIPDKESGPKRFSNLSKVTQLGSARAWSWTSVWLIWKHSSYIK